MKRRLQPESAVHRTRGARSAPGAASTAATAATAVAAGRPRAAAAVDAPGRIRIIGGRFRRTPITVVDAPGLRPTPDRVRTTLFNWLDHLLGDWTGIDVLDLFAGSGALGFECASRGASRVLLVENHPGAAAGLRALQRRLDCTSATVIEGDWRSAAARQSPASLDLIFLDPPFDSGLLPEAIAAVRALLRPGALLYVESAQALSAEALAQWSLETLRHGRAGAVCFYLLRARSY
jgi:16S rRNA (guanine(966)-N(2))-methyltransferase RsmD